MYYKNRYYSPALGRFVSRDTVEHEAKTTNYEYVFTKPTVSVDPAGRHALTTPLITVNPATDTDCNMLCRKPSSPE
jgi:hypothetical protein